jgi:hypothetical protein
LTLSKGLIDLKASESEGIQSKAVMSSISQVANGVGSVLTAVNIPEAEFLVLTGKLAGIGAEQQNFSEQFNKKDTRGIVGTTVSLSKGAWGAVVSGVNVAKLSANFGLKIGVVNAVTVGKITTTATKISKLADKIALPFAVAGTGLSFWDWHKSSGKIDSKKQELLIASIERIESSPHKKSLESKKEKDLKKEIGVLKTNSNIMGISFGLSAISTTALISSVVFPQTAYITEPLAVGGTIATSVIGTLADDKTRDSLKNTYEKVKEKYNYYLNKIDGLITGKQPTIVMGQ